MSAATFADGIAAGDPTSTSIVLWTREPSLDEIGWVVQPMSTDDPPLTGVATVDHDRDHTVHVAIEGLVPGTRYQYRFHAGGRTSRAGWFRTLPSDDRTLRFGVVTCAKYNAGYFHSYRELAERDDLDFILHLGDYVYEAAEVPPLSQTPGADIGRSFEPRHECRSLDDYRARYRQYRRDPDAALLHERHAMIVMVDDHELADNAWEGGAQEHDEARDGPWAERMHAALRAWEEWQPTRRRPTSGGAIHLEVALGGLGHLLALECRTHRQPSAQPATQLGADQQAWLLERLGAAPPGWLLLAVPSTLRRFWSPDLDEVARAALGRIKVIEPDGSGPFHDLWDAYGDERAAILGALAARGGPRLVLSGDVHVALESELRTVDGRLAAAEATAPSVTSPNFDDKQGWVGTDRSAAAREALLAQLDGLRWCDLDSHGYLLVELRSERATVEWHGGVEVVQPLGRSSLLRRSVVEQDGGFGLS